MRHEKNTTHYLYAYSTCAVPQKDIPKLGGILDSYDEEELKKKQERVKCAAQHFHWSGSLGGIMLETGVERWETSPWRQV